MVLYKHSMVLYEHSMVLYEHSIIEVHSARFVMSIAIQRFTLHDSL
jgi:hypothetical protein